MKALCIFSCLLFLLGTILCYGEEKGDSMEIKDGSRVSFDYVLTVDGKVTDKSEGRGPMEYVDGDKKLLPALTGALKGMKAGDEKTVVLKPEEAYGEKNEKAVREVPRSILPKGVEPRIGMPLQVHNPDGRSAVVTITEIKDDTVVIDFNHPLAGKTLTFKVKIVSVA